MRKPAASCFSIFIAKRHQAHCAAWLTTVRSSRADVVVNEAEIWSSKSMNGAEGLVYTVL